MNAVPQVTEIPSFAQHYIRHGWKLCAIPPGTKGPTAEGWNLPENALTLEQPPPPMWGVGLLHAYSGTCAIDIDDFDLAAGWFALRGIDINELLNAPDAVQITSGTKGRAKLIYQTPFPLPTKKVLLDKDGENVCALELRCATATGNSMQDVLPPSRHPSGTFYEWTGKGNWKDLPLLPAAIMAVWDELINAEKKREFKVPNTTATSLEEIQLALYAISPDCDRQTWVEVGMAINAIDRDAWGFDLWNEWSKGSTAKYPQQREMEKQWASFKPMPQGITIATLFHHAYKAGWTRPAPDIKSLFSAIKEERDMQDVLATVSVTTPLPKNNLSLWPDVLVRRATEVAREVGCDAIVPLVAGLLAVSGAADKRTILEINPTWKVPPTLWAMTIGEPADKKTPGSKPMFKPLHQLEFEDKDRHRTEMLMWKGIEARYAAEQKAYRDWAASPESQLPGATPPPMCTLPPMPEPLRLLINDATSQKVLTMSEHRPRGMLLYLDEMNKWLSKLSDPRNTDDRGSWIQGYETGPYSFDRMGSGSIRIENLGLSLYGNCQPAVFRQHLSAGSTDGIMQRFLPVVLNPKANALWEQALPEFLSSAGEYEQLIRRTFALPTTTYTFSPDGGAIFRRFCQDMLSLRDAERLLSNAAGYMTALGKVEGNCARLALLFHLVEDPHNPVIPVSTVLRACQLFDSFFVPSIRYTFLEVGQQADPSANHIFAMLVQWSSVKPTVSLSEVRKASRIEAGSRPVWQVDQLLRVTMEEFERLGYVTMYQDHPRSPSWAINPELANAFKEYRRSIITAKQTALDRLKHDAEKRYNRKIENFPSVIGAETV